MADDELEEIATQNNYNYNERDNRFNRGAKEGHGYQPNKLKRILGKVKRSKKKVTLGGNK